jgi:chorismate mutase-like protein
MDIADWRRKIDEIDRKLVEILNQRAQAAQEIGRLKRDADLPVYEPDRERTVLTKVQEMNQGPLHHRHLLQIYERIMDVMRNIQKDEIVKKDEIVGEPGTAGVGDTELDADVQD